MRTTLQFFSSIAIALACYPLPSVWAQGSLTPPGAPAPTMKTLDQIEPRTPIPGGNNQFIINTAGSYSLTGHLTNSTGSAIVINASDVNLDLNGFVVVGSGLSPAIEVPATQRNITIRNGTVTAYTGISATNTTALTIADVQCVTCNEGILMGDQGQVRNASLQNHQGRVGIRGGQGCVVRATTIQGGRCWTPIQLGEGGLVEGCVISGLGRTTSASYTIGIATGRRSVVRDCVVSSCGVEGNSFTGISAGDRSLIEGCNVSGNTNSSATVLAIAASFGSTVQNCVVGENSGDGIRAFGGCVVRDNTSVDNRTGILATGTGSNRLDGNTVTYNGIGINANTTGNFIIRNHANNNSTNYFLISANKVGVIVNVPASAAVSGSTGGAGVGTTDPWANTSY